MELITYQNESQIKFLLKSIENQQNNENREKYLNILKIIFNYYSSLGVELNLKNDKNLIDNKKSLMQINNLKFITKEGFSIQLQSNENELKAIYCDINNPGFKRISKIPIIFGNDLTRDDLLKSNIAWQRDNLQIIDDPDYKNEKILYIGSVGLMGGNIFDCIKYICCCLTCGICCGEICSDSQTIIVNQPGGYASEQQVLITPQYDSYHSTGIHYGGPPIVPYLGSSTVYEEVHTYESAPSYSGYEVDTVIVDTDSSYGYGDYSVEVEY